MPAESISMSQYHQQHQHHFHPGNSGGGTLPRSSHGHQGHHLAYETHTGGGTLKRGTYHHNGNHILSIPDCVQPVPNAVIFGDGDDFHQERGGFDHDLSTKGERGSSMRLYMNQNAVVMGEWTIFYFLFENGYTLKKNGEILAKCLIKFPQRIIDICWYFYLE